MPIDSKFLAASRAAESWLNTVSFVAQFGKGGGVDQLFKLLMPTPEVRNNLQDSYYKHSEVLRQMRDKLANVSEGLIEWEHGRGRSGLARSPAAVYPHIWLSAHDLAVGIAGLVLEQLVYPLAEITNPDKQRTMAKRLLARRWKPLAISLREVALYQKRICRERAKLLEQSEPEEEIPLLERVLAVLTPGQQRFMEYLWKKKTASFDALKNIPEAWQYTASDDAITKKIKAIRTRLEAAELWNVSINISGRRVNLNRPK